MSTVVQPPTFREILSQSRRIIKTNTTKFFPISFLLLLPLCLCLTIYPTQIILRYTSNPPTISLPLLLLYTIFLFLLWVSTLATITHTTYQAFSGKTHTLTSTLKSIPDSFIPLLSTTAISIVTYEGFILLAWNGMRYAQTYWFQITHNGTEYYAFCMTVLIIFCAVVSLLHTNWALASVIAVVESKWGFEPLRRSAYLIKGMRKVSFLLLLFFTTGCGMLVGGYSMWVEIIGVNTWRDWSCISHLVECSAFLMVYMFYYMIINTVVYLYCKASHGEFANEEEIAPQYVLLSVDDENENDAHPGSVGLRLITVIMLTAVVISIVVIHLSTTFRYTFVIWL